MFKNKKTPTIQITKTVDYDENNKELKSAYTIEIVNDDNPIWYINTSLRLNKAQFDELVEKLTNNK